MNHAGAVPSSWRYMPLSDVGTWVGGGTPSKSNPAYWSGGSIPWVSPKDMKSDRIVDTQDHITEAAVEQSSTNLVAAGSVLVVVRSGILSHTLPVAISTRQVALNQDLKAVMPRSDIDSGYLALALRAFEDDILHNCTKTGTTVQSVEMPKFLSYGIPVAPLDRQREIVAEIEKQFSRLDAGVASLKCVQANLKRYRVAVLKAACEGRLVPTEAELARQEGRTYETGAQLLERILAERRAKSNGREKAEVPLSQSEVTQHLPEGWVWATLDQLSAVVRGASPRPAGDPRFFGGEIPWITVRPLTRGGSPYLHEAFETLTQLGMRNSRYIEADTLLLTNSGATLGVPKITRIGGCINDGVVALLDVPYPLKLYLVYFLRTQTESLRRINQGAAQPNLNTSIIRAIKVPLPPAKEQRRIAEEVERLMSVIEEIDAAVTASLQRAARLRRSVLQLAFKT